MDNPKVMYMWSRDNYILATMAEDMNAARKQLGIDILNSAMPKDMKLKALSIILENTFDHISKNSIITYIEVK